MLLLEGSSAVEWSCLSMNKLRWKRKRVPEFQCVFKAAGSGGGGEGVRGALAPNNFQNLDLDKDF